MLLWNNLLKVRRVKNRFTFRPNKMAITIRFFILLFFFIQCKPKTATDKIDPSLFQPDVVFELPDELREISGIALLSDSTIACVEDEHGLVYLYNLPQGKIYNQIPFANDGDYEDIVIKGLDLFVLRSDGLILKISNFDTDPHVTEIETGLNPDFNFEGLSLSGTDGLLLASKAENAIYTLDLVQEKIVGNPLHISTSKHFFLSALAFHPTSGFLYVLGAVGKSLLILSKEGTIQKSIDLKNDFFIQPEGIAFNGGGDLYISNEGRHGKANILLFKNKSEF